ncbi:Uncharacterized protein HZ326_23331 [Fusarium oxysporum f. sp. albedinis]|nr:Uncharacterized protein HZ326_23331 [Fusarium oxysporum f. sp. albedinis]
MHEVVLLRSELRNLRDANEILSRRRRTKRTRLQHGGAMTVQEASQVIDQMDVDTQAAAESSRSSGRGRSKRPGGRRCGVCGKAGHNARTCQVVIETSGEEYTYLDDQHAYQPRDENNYFGRAVRKTMSQAAPKRRGRPAKKVPQTEEERLVSQRARSQLY